MGTEDFKGCKKLLQGSDSRTLQQRSKRLEELLEVPISTLFHSQRVSDYDEEASNSYINGSYRSVIFCCACSIDPILRHEYLKIPGNNLEDLKSGKKGNEEMTFGEVIVRCETVRVPKLIPFLEKAKLLNKMRNTVSVHPSFIDPPTVSPSDKSLRHELLIQYITRVLEVIEKIDPAKKKEIRDRELRMTLSDETDEVTYVLGKIIDKRDSSPYNLDVFWALVEESVLKFLAYEAMKIVKEIEEGLYGTELDRSTVGL